MNNLFLLIKVSACLLVFNLTASACSVPVFRYALERWPVSPYIAMVVTDTPLTKNEQTALTKLEKAGDGVSGSLNIAVRQMTSDDLAESSVSDLLPKPQNSGAQLHLFFPVTEEIQGSIWSGKLTMDAVNMIIDSPFRKTLIEKIIEGNSGVYILLECGDKKKDDAAAKTMKAHLTEVTKELSLPDGVVETDGTVTGGGNGGGYDPIDRLQSNIPLKTSFATLRLSRNSTDDVLVAILMNVENGLRDYNDQPMVFAVYGRARMLPPLIGKGITLNNIGEIAYFLTGACSCQVKSLNPGVDLLVNHDWDQSVFGGE